MLAGGVRIRSRTVVAVSGARAETMYSYFVCSTVMPRVANCAFTWANHRSGSDGHNGGSLTETALTDATGGSPSPGIVRVTTVELRWRRC